MKNNHTKSFFAWIFTQFSRQVGLGLFFIFLMSDLRAAQPTATAKRVMTGSAATNGTPANLKVLPDLRQRLARFRRVPMPLRTVGLSARDQQSIRKLVEASSYLESIYWRQSDPAGLLLYQALASSRNARDIELRRMLWINASRFDMIDDNKPIVGTESQPAGQGFYPADLTHREGDLVQSRALVGSIERLRRFRGCARGLCSVQLTRSRCQNVRRMTQAQNTA